MEKKLMLFLGLILVSLLIISCEQETKAPVEKTETPPSEINVADDEEEEEEPPEVEEEIPEMDEEVKELLEVHKTKIKSLQYKYKGPGTQDHFYNYYLKGTKMKYEPWRETKSYDLDEMFDTIYLDTEAETAASYCDDRQCKPKGKRDDLVYADVYFKTPLDWIEEITEAEKIGEERIQKRDVWKLQTNIGDVWIDTFYGVPLELEVNSYQHVFDQMAFNTVGDDEVVPLES